MKEFNIKNIVRKSLIEIIAKEAIHELWWKRKPTIQRIKEKIVDAEKCIRTYKAVKQRCDSYGQENKWSQKDIQRCKNIPEIKILKCAKELKELKEKLVREKNKSIKEDVDMKLKQIVKEALAEVLAEQVIKQLKEAEGMEGLPKGWTHQSVKKFSKSLTGKEGTKEGFFEKCVEKMKGKVSNPEAFCASVKDELHGSTYWRGKDKSPQEAGKDVKAHQNVKQED